jgi:hypothetical protein
VNTSSRNRRSAEPERAGSEQAATRKHGQQRPTGSLRPHAQAELVPAMAADQYEAFLADIAERGVLCPLEITREGVVLDGRERIRAATELGIEQLPVRIVEPADEVEHIILAALQRRQLSASQRAALVLELDSYHHLQAEARSRQRANLRHSLEVANSPPRGKSRDHAAAWAGVSARTIQDAATVQAHDPPLFERVKQASWPPMSPRAGCAARSATRRCNRRRRCPRG